jgi:hypothetical protein
MVIPKAPSGFSLTVICAIGVCFPELNLDLLESHLLALCFASGGYGKNGYGKCSNTDRGCRNAIKA